MAFDLCRIGQLLRETRERKGLTLDEVSDVLCIRRRAIGAIEAGDWESLPHPVYVKGYVTHYATFLDVPGLIEGVAASGEEGSFPHHPADKPSEAPAGGAFAARTDWIWRSVVATGTLKFYELCRRCCLL